MSTAIIYDYDYFANKTPFKKTLEKFADLSISSTWYGSRDNRTYHYTISYNQRKFIENIAAIKTALLNTKKCQYLEDVRKDVEAIPENIEDYTNAYAINTVVSNLVIEGCIRQTMSSCKYTWDVKEAYKDDIDFNRESAKRMRRPLLKLHEVNGWERESWNFYFKYPTDDETFELFKKLSERLSAMPKMRQINGESYFILNMVPIDYKAVKWDNKWHYGYMPKHNLIEGSVNKEKLREILKLSNDGLFEAMYKGGVNNIFE